MIRQLSLLVVTVLAVSGCATTDRPAKLPTHKQEVVSFQPVILDVKRLNQAYGASNVLIVLDIDNTLLTSSVDLGGDIWYQWQRGKLDIKPEPAQKVACLFEDAIGLLYELGPMNLTEENLPSVVSTWQMSGNTVMALTSRSPRYRAATERELYRKGFNFEVTALSPRGEKPPVYREKRGRELSYMKGVMMTTGMNKGDMLEYLLDKTSRRFDAIVFVDDSQKNIDNVYEKYKPRSDIDTNIYHYVKVEQDRIAEYGAVLTHKQADKMHKDWVDLNKTLNTVFPQRHKDGSCLSVD
ncbi:DUF2608 domain-containing protein [Aestuariirhabdus haliotis]|nr:DUF2608 domain-containing protein [Aestuariirhabdus haliotis]MCL6420684.1 DUF2608 domain-containing protein [Aestuariirhabdus haliotis]